MARNPGQSSMATEPQLDPQRTQLRDEVVVHVQGLILSGGARPGTLLRLAPIAEALGASITPVREALLLLTQDGWVTQEPNRGFRVLPIRRRDAEDAYLVHGFVAGELAARAAAVIDARGVGELTQLNAQIARITGPDANVSDADSLEVDILNSRLHSTIYASAASPRLTWFRDASMRFVPRRHWGAVPGWIELNRDGHAELIDALAQSDCEGARTAMVEHIERAGMLLLSHLDEIGFWDRDADD
ncbi:MAG TPA: GntR family transcriptional regulator [Solirubrobacteraceae bacterium]|jgi:DNA-binding GntR family transcriptional regulator